MKPQLSKPALDPLIASNPFIYNEKKKKALNLF